MRKPFNFPTVMPIPQCIASRVSPCPTCHNRATHRSSVSRLCGTRIGTLLVSVLFTGGVLAQPPADVLSKPDAEKTAAAADSSTSAANPSARPTRNYNRFYFQTSLYTTHFNPDPQHDNHNRLLNAEYRFDKEWLGGRWIAGAAAFDNSFSQPSQYLYGGWLYPIPRHESFYVKVSAGILHGYKAPYENKIPFNHSGYAPAIVPAAGYCYRKVCSELILFGSAGAMLTLGVAIP